MTCLAVWAAMRPSSSISISEPISSPISASLSYARASLREISAFGLLTDSTMIFLETTEISPVLESISTWMFSAWPKRFLAAVCRAASIAPMTFVLSIPFWRPISSITEINSLFMFRSPLEHPPCLPRHGPLGLRDQPLLQRHSTNGRSIVNRQRHRLIRDVGQCSHQAPLSGEGFSELYRDSFSDGPTIVLKPLERPVQ